MKIYKISNNIGNIPKECMGGDCFVVSGKYMMDNCRMNNNLRLVHGYVTGQGKIEGIRYEHGWIEDG